MKLYEVTTKEQLDDLGSAITIEGLAIEGVEDYLNWIRKYTPILNETVYVTKGKTMNEAYGLTGSNAYNDDLTIVSVDLDDVEDWSKLVWPRFEIGARWLDDIISNNIMREEEKIH